VLLDELTKAKAVIVIWSATSVKSRFVIDEAGRALNADKLISTCLPGFNLTTLPLGFGGRHTDLVSERRKICTALRNMGVEAPAALPFSPSEEWAANEHFPLDRKDETDPSHKIESSEVDWEVLWLEEEAMLDDINAVNELGHRLAHGQGVTKNEAEAVEW
jgi:hypothetical protein